MPLITFAAKGSILERNELDNNFLFLQGLAQAAQTKAEAVELASYTKAQTDAAIDARIEGLIDTAPVNLDTLGEIATHLAASDSAAAALVTTLAGKADKATTLAGYGIADAYTKAEVDAMVGGASGSAGDKVNNKGNIAGAVALNYADGSYVVATVTAATTLSLAGVPNNTEAFGLTIELYNGGTNVTWPGTITWVAGVAPTLKASGVNMITLVTRNGGTSWIGTAA